MELTGATVFLTTCSNDSSLGRFGRRDDFPSSMFCISLETSDSGSIVFEWEPWHQQTDIDEQT